MWSKGGGFHESVMVVKLMEMMEKLSGGAVGAIGKDINTITMYTFTVTQIMTEH